MLNKLLSNIILITYVFYFVTGSRITENKGDRLTIEIPEECKGKGGCMAIPKDYDKIVAKFDELLPEFLKNNYADRMGEEIKPRNKTKFYEGDENNCAYEVSEHPYTFYNGFAVAQTSNFVQYIKNIVCLPSKHPAGKQCYRDVLNSSEVLDQKSSCEIIYRPYSIYVLKENVRDAPVVSRVFQIPACCVCHVTYNKIIKSRY